MYSMGSRTEERRRRPAPALRRRRLREHHACHQAGADTRGRRGTLMYCMPGPWAGCHSGCRRPLGSDSRSGPAGQQARAPGGGLGEEALLEASRRQAPRGAGVQHCAGSNPQGVGASSPDPSSNSSSMSPRQEVAMALATETGSCVRHGRAGRAGHSRLLQPPRRRAASHLSPPPQGRLHVQGHSRPPPRCKQHAGAAAARRASPHCAPQGRTHLQLRRNQRMLVHAVVHDAPRQDDDAARAEHQQQGRQHDPGHADVHAVPALDGRHEIVAHAAGRPRGQAGGVSQPLVLRNR